MAGRIGTQVSDVGLHPTGCAQGGGDSGPRCVLERVVRQSPSRKRHGEQR